MITSFLFRQLRRHKGIALALLLYSLYSAGKKLLEDGNTPAGTSSAASRRTPRRKH